VRIAHGLGRAQAAHGSEVTVVTTDAFDRESRHPYAGEVVELKGVTIHYLPNISNRLAYDHQLFMPRGIRKFFKREGPWDVIHLHGFRHVLTHAAMRSAKKNGTPLVISAQGTLPAIERKIRTKYIYDKLYGQKVIDSLGGAIAVANAEIADYINAGVPEKRIRVIPNGLNPEEFAELPERGRFRKSFNIPDGPFVLYLGKLTPRKGVEHLIRAMKNVDAHLVIAGNDMGHGAVLHDVVKSEGMIGQVTFTGLLVGEERPAAYQDAAVTVYPSVDEIFGLVPFESLLCGTPVIVSDDSGCGEIINEAKAGEVIPYGDVPALAEALKRVIENPDVVEIERGQKYIHENLTWPIVAKRTLEFYDDVIHGNFNKK